MSKHFGKLPTRGCSMTLPTCTKAKNIKFTFSAEQAEDGMHWFKRHLFSLRDWIKVDGYSVSCNPGCFYNASPFGYFIGKEGCQFRGRTRGGFGALHAKPSCHFRR